MFMCFFIHFSVYLSYFNFIAAHGVHIQTWARVYMHGKDANKDVVEQRTYGRGQVHTEFHFFDTNVVCVHRKHRHGWFEKYRPLNMESQVLTSGDILGAGTQRCFIIGAHKL